MHTLKLKNISFYGYHGVFEEEKKLGGKFEIDVELFFDFSKAAKSDSVEDTIDYGIVYQFIKNHFENTKYNLIEALAVNIADGILKEFKIEKVKINLRKFNLPIKGEIGYSEAEVIKSNDE